MVTLFFGLLSAAVTLFLISLLKLYRHTPSKELRRQAQSGDQLAKHFYRVVAFGRSLDILLWLFIGIFAALFFVLCSNALPWPLAFLVVLGVVWFGFAWLPNTHVSRFTLWTARYTTPPLHWLLEHLQPVLIRIAQFVDSVQPFSVHTGLYTKEDIIDLIKRQKVQIDNRITKDELYIVEHALQFGEKRVDEVMTPKRVVKLVATTDMIGPVLLKELHDSGHSRFPVYKDNQDDLVGTLYIRDALGAKAGGFVKDLMRKEVFYVNQDQNLARVLDAFIKTKHHQFVVVNNFAEIVGVITIEDVIEQVIGKQIIDEFDNYDDMRAVAAMEAEKAHASKEHKTVVESKEDEQENTK